MKSVKAPTGYKYICVKYSTPQCEDQCPEDILMCIHLELALVLAEDKDE